MTKEFLGTLNNNKTLRPVKPEARALRVNAETKMSHSRIQKASGTLSWKQPEQVKRKYLEQSCQKTPFCYNFLLFMTVFTQ